MKALGLVLYSCLFAFMAWGVAIPCGDPAPKPVIAFSGTPVVKNGGGSLQGRPKRGKRHSRRFFARRPGGDPVILDRSKVTVKI